MLADGAAAAAAPVAAIAAAMATVTAAVDATVEAATGAAAGEAGFGTSSAAAAALSMVDEVTSSTARGRRAGRFTPLLSSPSTRSPRGCTTLLPPPATLPLPLELPAQLLGQLLDWQLLRVPRGRPLC